MNNESGAMRFFCENSSVGRARPCPKVQTRSDLGKDKAKKIVIIKK